MRIVALLMIVWLLCGFIASGWAWADLRAEGANMRCVAVQTPFFIMSGPVALIGWPISRWAVEVNHGWEMPFTNIDTGR